MTIRTTRTTYGNLDDRQKALMRDKTIEASMTLDEWIPFLAAVAKCDRIGDGRRKLAGGGAILSLVGCGIAWPALEDSFAHVFWLLPFTLAAIWWRLRSIDVPPVLDKFVLPWLVLLKEDVSKGAHVMLKLDLRGAEATGKRVLDSQLVRDFGRVPPSPKDCQDQFFRDRWLSGTATLADGNILRLGVSDFVRKRVKTRRNARGKTKSKTKYKVQRNFDVLLTARSKAYHVQPAASAAGFRCSVKRGEKRNSIRVRSRNVERNLEAQPRLANLMSTIACAYAHLSAPAKKELS